MRILHILDHSLPLHSGYSFRTIAILREQRARGWETMQLTTPRQGDTAAEVEDAEGWRFHRTPMRRAHGVPTRQQRSPPATAAGTRRGWATVEISWIEPPRTDGRSRTCTSSRAGTEQ